MLVSVRAGADPKQVRDALAACGLWVEPMIDATGRTHFLVARHSAAVDVATLAAIDGVESVAQAKEQNPLITRQGQAAEPVRVGDIAFGRGAPPVWMAGPCSIEAEAQVHAMAARLAPWA